MEIYQILQKHENTIKCPQYFNEYIQGATQEIPKFERCVQSARSTVISR
jgi:hypothetical protein